jgi:hypothetical protein
MELHHNNEVIEDYLVGLSRKGRLSGARSLNDDAGFATLWSLSGLKLHKKVLNDVSIVQLTLSYNWSS